MTLLQMHDSSCQQVDYGSRVLANTEISYSRIEKGFMYRCEHFHDFIYDRRVTAETDHTPLVAISKKNFGDMLPHLQ